MVEQLSLNLVQPIRYSADNYVLHSGIAEVAASVLVLASRKAASTVYVQGDRWSGKTHFGAYLAGELEARGVPTRFLEGSEVVSWFENELPSAPLKAAETIIIDDADHFLRGINRSGKGSVLVDLLDELRSLKGTIVLLGTFGPNELGCGPHITGSVRAGLHLRIGSPKESELGGILDVICKQRGMKFSTMKRSYVLRRVKCDIHALVEIVERVEGISESASGASTSFQVLAEAVGLPDAEQPGNASEPLKASGWR